jgi:hypothetical protein
MAFGNFSVNGLDLLDCSSIKLSDFSSGSTIQKAGSIISHNITNSEKNDAQVKLRIFSSCLTLLMILVVC